MKLKKIAALALAGVMAVSMLAGCSGGSKKDDTTSGVNAAAVIDALGKDNKVAFSASSTLESTVQKAIQNIGLDNVGDISVTDLAAVDKTLDGDQFKLSTGDDAENEKIDKNSDTVTVVKAVKVANNYGDTYTVQKLADAMKGEDVQTGSVKITGLSNYGTQEYTDSTSSNKYYYKFSYTGNVAVVAVPNADATATETTYVVAFTVTRNAAKTAVPSKG